MDDKFYMNKALKLARKGAGWTSPNPMVGAVIVKSGRIVSEGYHEKYGEYHAEINAINNASESIKGATFYVTLEPCSHFGKTPPCVDKLIELMPSKVVVGTLDPNPLVAGRGIRKLEDQGIKTTVGVLEDECQELNKKFFKFMTTGIPYVSIKYAQTVDGRIASSTGHSKWISSDPSLKFAHKLRSRNDAIVVGVGTVLADDPELTVRRVKGRNPIRIVLDPMLKIHEDSKIIRNQDKAKTIIATTYSCNKEKLAMLKNMGIEALFIDENNENKVDLEKLLIELGKRNISSILVEGGAKIITSFVKESLFDRMIIITAPKILGKGIEAVGDLGVERIDNAVDLVFKKISRKGDDIIMDARRKK